MDGQPDQGHKEEHKETIVDIKKKEKSMSKWKKIMVLFPAVLMILSVLAFALSFSNNSGNNNPTNNSILDQYPQIVVEGDIEDYTFYLIDGDYVVNSSVVNAMVPFRLDPRNATNILLEQDVVPAIIGANKIYMSFNPNIGDLGKLGVAVFEVSRVTQNAYGIKTVGAYTEDSDPIDYDVPIKTCEHSGVTGVVVEFSIDSNSTNKIVYEDECVKVIGSDADGLIAAADKLGMHLLGIEI